MITIPESASITELVNEFGSIGATLGIDENGDLHRYREYGIVVANGRNPFTVPIDEHLKDNLAIAFTKALHVLTLESENFPFLLQEKIATTDSIPTYGMWLDNEADPPVFAFECGRLFIGDNALDSAIAYGIEHDQRYGYNLANKISFEIYPPVLEVPEDDDLETKIVLSQ